MINDIGIDIHHSRIEANIVRLQNRNAELEKQLAELRKAAEAVVLMEMGARAQQCTHWRSPAIDALAELLEKNDGN